MDKLQLLSYKSRLLNAGVPYAVMKRNLRELQDHHDDLLQQALARGLSEAGAKAVAAHELGDFEQLVQAMLARPELRSKLHRYPLGMTILLPLLAHFVICVLLLLAFLYPAVITGSLDQIDTVNGVNLWLIPVFESLRLVLMFLVTPVLGCYLAFLSIRNHVPPRFWITGLVLLSLLGGSMQVHIDWGDPANGYQKSIGAEYFSISRQSFEEMGMTFALRFSVNVLLCGAFARVYRNKEQTAGT